MIVTEGWNAADALDAGDKKAIALKDRLGWLQEWESAQRQQRQQVGGQSTGSGEPQGWTTHEAPVPQSPRPQPGNPARSAYAHRPTTTAGEGVTVSKTASEGAIAGTRHDAAEGRTLGAAGTFSHTQDRAGSLPHAIGRRAPWVARTPSTWQPYVYQVVRSAAGLRVWIRDARISTSSGSAILNALQSQFACVGMTLASVTINGKTLWETPGDGLCPEESGSDTDNALLVNQLY